MQNKTEIAWLPLILVLVLGLLILSGCSDDPTEPVPGPTPVNLPESSTALVLMNNFLTVNEDMYIEGYEHILHDGFRIMISQQTFDAWEGSDNPINQLYFDRNAAITITGNMFSEQAGIDQSGIAIPPLSSISIDLMELLGNWEAVDESVNYFGGFENVFMANYIVLMYFNHPTNHRYEIDQILKFYAVDVSGGSQDEWELLGIAPLYGESASATEEVSYDSVLSLYR